LFVLLVIDASPDTNWYALFKDQHGAQSRRIRVEQTEWSLIDLFVDKEGCHVSIKPSPEPFLGTTQKYEREVIPDFLLIRQYVRGVHSTEWVNMLLGFMIANIPSVNSLTSIFQSTQRAISISELKKIEKRLGHSQFPFVPITYLPNTLTTPLLPSKAFPLVAKVGSSCAGVGKMRFVDADWSDFAGTMAMFREYVTTEPLLKNVGDVRIQKIGEHVRAYQRKGSNWKGNVGESTVTDLPVTPQYLLWAEEAAKIFGGLDILSIDCVVDEAGNHTILEVNDTATGLNPHHKQEDLLRIRDLVLKRILLIG